MNDMSFSAPEFFTAAELAKAAKERGLRGFPHSERRVRDYAEREGWNRLPDRLTRQRNSAKAGGRPSMEYHVSLLPEILQAMLQGRMQKARLAAVHGREADRDRAQIDALKASALAPRARRAMEARAEVLVSIESVAIASGKTRAWAIARFLAAQTAWIDRQESERRRDLGEFLTEREAAALARPLDLTALFQLSAEIIAHANDRKRGGVKRSAIYEWFKARDERGVVALAPEPPREAQPLPGWFPEFLQFYAIGSKPNVPAALVKYKESLPEGAFVPTEAQIRHILKNRLNSIEKNVGREGLLTLRSRLPYITRTTEDMWPTTIYEADGKTLDSEVADPVSRRPIRPEITSVVDVATRKCVGYAVSRKENVIAVTDALRRSCSAHGICAIFYTDRGAGYKNKTFDADVGGLMGRLGITKMHALPYNSQAKGVIERFNHVWNNLARAMPSYIGRDMDKEAGKAFHKETRTEIREIGFARRLPTWPQLIEAIEAEIAAYNDKPHEGLPRYEDPHTGALRHMSPNQAWAAHVAAGFEAVTIDAEEQDDLFRHYEIRSCRRAQVQWNTNEYYHEALEAYHERKVMVGYDLNQADKVWVREFDAASGQPGKLICVAIYLGNAQRYVPLTYERAAMEGRNKAALKRLEDKSRAKREELDAPFLLEHQPVADFIDLTPAPVAEPVALTVEDFPVGPSVTRRQVFASDAALAAWALENPQDLTPNQITVLRRCIANHNSSEVLRLSGIDTEALRTLLRAAA